MTDRELLKLAAKSAGYTLTWGESYIVDGDLVDCTDLPYIKGNQHDEADWYWNPLDDDGDALRLAVKLNMQVECSRGYQHVSVYGRDFTISECHDGINPEAATRRAIVRAAAEIGEAMA